MQIRDNNYSIAEIQAMLERHDLHINRDYQRGAGLWPLAPRSYFIDTIIRGFPVPKIYFYEFLDTAANGMRLRRELVDGQQRITTIMDFIGDNFAMAQGHAFPGRRFSQLDDDVQRAFMAYTVSVDVIRDAPQAEIVEMFRRMNAYTLPLNDAEKRHAAFQGEFKWYINFAAGQFGDFFHEFGVFTNRQMVRMADQEMLAETYMFTKEGITNSSPSAIRQYYSKYDATFADQNTFSSQLFSAIEYITTHFGLLRGTYMMKPYAFFTLLTALIFNRYATPALPAPGVDSERMFARNAAIAERRLLELAQAHEAKETDGPFRSYVQGCLSSTHRAPQRLQRFEAVITALQMQ